MTEFNNILCVITGPDDLAAIRRASRLAKQHAAQLTFAMGLPTLPPRRLLTSDSSILELESAVRDECAAALEKLAASQHGLTSVATLILRSQGFLPVIQAVLKGSYDLLVKQGENPTSLPRLSGSIDMHLLRKCPSAVLLVRPEEPESYRQVLAAVDVDPDLDSRSNDGLNQQIMTLASHFADSDTADFHVVHSWDVPSVGLVRRYADDPDGEEARLERSEHLLRSQRLARLCDDFRAEQDNEGRGSRPITQHLPRGLPASRVPAVANRIKADLVVMGTIARTGIPGLIIGNTAESILDRLNCSVLALKPKGFKSPVTVDS